MGGFKLCSVFLSLAVLWIAITHGSNLDTRIVGGTTTTISKVKYLVYLRVNGYFSCGGSLVGSRYVVTAAHCVKGVKAANIKVHGGTSYLNKSGKNRSVSKIILPTAYNSNTMHMDVAVLKLSSAMSGTNIALIQLCSRTIPNGGAVKVSGWGLTNENGNVSNQVRSVVVEKISKSSCTSKYKGQASLTNTMLCATKSGKDSCSGDSGGPLVYKGQLCGIVSWGIGCARNAYPGVYTSVSTVKSFIKKAMQK